MKKVILIFACLCVWMHLAKGQPIPTTDRKVVWIKPVSSNNVAGYELKWGTNRQVIAGYNTDSALIKLEPGVNTIVLRSAPLVGVELSDPVTNKTRMLRYSLEYSISGGPGSWGTLTSHTFAVEMKYTNEFFRTRLDWSAP